MSDIFSELFAQEPIDPIEAARRSVKRKQRARFYQHATVAEAPDGFQILLDGKPVRTPARHLLAAPTRVLAEAIAAEWDSQRETIDPVRMPQTRLANAIIDGVVKSPQPVAAEIEKYLGSDLLCYRADTPERLVALQAQHWDPVIEWARDGLGARFVLAQGVVFAQQPEGAIAAAARAIPCNASDVKEIWRLGALSSITTLTGSALLALALAHGRLDADAAWAAANVDEDWNMQTWGGDEVALARREFRLTEMQAAATVLSALR